MLAGSQHQMTQACYFVRGKCNYNLMVKNCKICLETPPKRALQYKKDINGNSLDKKDINGNSLALI